MIEGFIKRLERDSRRENSYVSYDEQCFLYFDVYLI